MWRYAGYEWVLGVPEIRVRIRSPRCGLPVRSIFRARPSKPRFAVPELFPSPQSWARLPHPSWATTKERAAWRFGA